MLILQNGRFVPQGSHSQPGKPSSRDLPSDRGPIMQKSFTLVNDIHDENGNVLRRAGDVITQAVTVSDVSETREIETYLGGYSPFGFGADIIAKPVLVDKLRGKRRDFSKANTFQPVNDRTGKTGAIKEIEHQSDVTPYECEEHALAAYIQFETEHDAVANYNVRAAHSTEIGDKLTLNREIEIWGTATTAANWNANNVTTIATAALKWNGTAPAILSDLHARIKASAQPVNGIFFNPDVAFVMLKDNDVRSYMRQMLGDAAPSPDVAGNAESMGVQTFAIPGFPKFYIVPSKVLNATTDALDFILGNDVVFATMPPGAINDGRHVATMMTFRYRGRSGTGWVVNEYVPYGKGLNGGTMFEQGFSDANFIGSNIAGGLIKSVLG